MSRILTVAHLTLYEARRRRIVTAAALCGLAFLAVFSAGMFFVHREMVQDATPLYKRQALLGLLTVAGLYGTNFLTVLFAILLPVDALSGEIDSGVMQTLASKPLRRADIVLGKWTGYAVIIVSYLLLLATGVLLAARLTSGYIQINVPRALALMSLEAMLLLTVSIAGGTRLSTVTNGIVTLGFYGVAFIGGWVEQIGGLDNIQAAKNIGIAVSLISPADALWRLAAYYLQPQIMRDTGATPFSSASVPNALMVWWAAGFTALTLAWAMRSFRRRPL